MRVVKKGATSQTVYLVALDSASTTGGRKTGILFNSAGLTAYYTRNGAAAVAITLATLASASAAWSSGGFVEVSATNAPGLYRLDVPDAAFAAGAGDSVVVSVKGAAGMVQADEEVQLVAVDLQDAVALGLSRIDAAVTSRMATFTLPANFAAFSLDASGRVDLGKWIGVAPAALSVANGYVQTMARRWLTDDAAGTPNALITGRVDANAQVVADKTGYTASTVSDKTGYSLSAAGVQAIWDALTSALTTVGSVGKRIADNLDALVSSRLATAGYTAPPTAAAVSTQVWTEPLPGAFGAGSAGAKLNGAASAGDPWTTALPGAYGAGTAGNILGSRLDAAVSSRGTGAALTGAQVEGAVWDATAASHNTAGTTGNKLTAAGAAGDPWSTAVPGAYAAGTAGNILGSRLDVAVSTRASGGGGLPGSGSLTVTITVTRPDGVTPIEGAAVWVTTDLGGTNVVAGTLYTSTLGKVTVFLDAGTYYVWRQATSWNLSNPQTITVS